MSGFISCFLKECVHVLCCLRRTNKDIIYKYYRTIIMIQYCKNVASYSYMDHSISLQDSKQARFVIFLIENKVITYNSILDRNPFIEYVNDMIVKYAIKNNLILINNSTIYDIVFYKKDCDIIRMIKKYNPIALRCFYKNFIANNDGYYTRNYTNSISYSHICSYFRDNFTKEELISFFGKDNKMIE